MGKQKILGREAILQADDLPRRVVEVPEWGGAVIVRGLTGAERDRLEQAAMVPGPDGQPAIRMEGVRALMAAMAIVDEEGNRLFSEADVEALAQKNAAALDRIFRVASELSGLGEEAVKEAEKN